LAHRREIFQVQVIQQVQAQCVERQHVNGKADAVDRAGGGVVVAVTAERRDLALGEQFEGRRVQSRPGLRDIPRPQLDPAPTMPDLSRWLPRLWTIWLSALP
jgi:hypothetical protein